MWRPTYRPVRHNGRLLGGSVSRRGVLLAALGNARVLLGARAGMFVSLNGSLVGRTVPRSNGPDSHGWRRALDTEESI